jgi:hypothetical protein
LNSYKTPIKPKPTLHFPPGFSALVIPAFFRKQFDIMLRTERKEAGIF